MIDVFVNLDENILLWIQNNLRNDTLTSFFKLITSLGDGGFIWVIFTIILLLCNKTKKIGIMSAITLILASIMNNLILKEIFERTRPYEVVEGLNSVIGNMNSFSFPSGHTASSFAMATVLYRQLPFKFGILAIVLAILIGFSRMYLGVHYPSDVCVGILIGIVSGYITVNFYNKFSNQRQ